MRSAVRVGGVLCLGFVAGLTAHCGSTASSDRAPELADASDDGPVGTSTSPEKNLPGGDAGAPKDDPDAWSAPDVGAPIEAGSPGTVDITMQVHADETPAPISPYVYGVNNGGQAAAHHATIVRSGGNRLTAYNWENNASNEGSDNPGTSYQFENDDFLCSTTTCTPNDDAPGAYLKAIVDQATAAGADTVLTVPIVDYVAADKSPGGNVMNSGANYLMTRFKQNGIKGQNLQNPPNTTDAYVYQDEMVNWVAQAEPHATIRWQLDNEPDLWSSTHAEVHPDPVTYAELLKRDVDFAKAIKSVVPGAFVIGPVNYGWTGYVNLQNASDAKADGDFLTWWLGQMASAAKTYGKPVVDGLDLHWYSEAGDSGPSNPGNGGPAGSDCRVTSDPKTNSGMAADCYTTQGQAGTAAAREQATRSLWDPTYVEDSWIPSSIGNEAIQLIPLVHGKIQKNDPGMRLSFTEWNYGGGSDISGTIATADVLGIFGAYGVDMASLFEVWHDESFTYAAYDAYRNYDGKGAAFGDTSIPATTSDVPDSSVYASVTDADPSHLVIVAINKAQVAKTAGIVIHHSTVFTTAAVYTITQPGGAKVVAAPSITAVATNAFRYSMPAQSVSVLVPSP